MQDVSAHTWDASKAALPAWSLPKDAVGRIALPTHWPERVTREWALDGATGEGVRVCILDSGVDGSHPLVGDLASAVVISVDEDGEVVAEEDTDGDVSGHGTACAGIVRKLAPEASISSVRVLGASFTGSGSVLLGGLRYAIDQGFDIVNMSLSTTKKPFASILHELADSAYFKRTVLVASAHNMRMKTYLVAYRDPERNEYEYVLRARSRRRARADAKRWVGVGRIDWNAALVSVTPYPPPGRARRLVSVAGITFVAAGTTIFAATIVALSLQGAV